MWSENVRPKGKLSKSIPDKRDWVTLVILMLLLIIKELRFTKSKSEVDIRY